MLDIKNLNKSYKMGDSSLHVLKGIDLHLLRVEKWLLLWVLLDPENLLF